MDWCVQNGLDYAQPLQTFVPLLCDSLFGNLGHLVSLKSQDANKQASADLTVASLDALREYILLRRAATPC